VAVFDYRRAMVDRFLATRFGFGAHELRDMDYRTKRFSCSVCGEEA